MQRVGGTGYDTALATGAFVIVRGQHYRPEMQNAFRANGHARAAIAAKVIIDFNPELPFLLLLNHGKKCMNPIGVYQEIY